MQLYRRNTVTGEVKIILPDKRPVHTAYGAEQPFMFQIACSCGYAPQKNISIPNC